MRILLSFLCFICISAICHAQVDSLMNLGRSYAVKRDFDNAALYFNKALEVSKSEVDKGRVANNLALVFTLKKEYYRSIKFYQTALKHYRNEGHNEKIAETLLNIGSTYRRKGDIESAKSNYEKAFILSSSHKTKNSALNNIGRLIYADGDYQEGIEYYKNLISKSDPFYQLYQNLARLYAKTNQLDLAEEQYKLAIENHGSKTSPVYIELKKEFADMLYRSGIYNRAQSNYVDAILAYERLRNLYLIDKTKLNSTEVNKTMYLSAIECAAKGNRLDEVFGLTEILKAPVLSEKVRLNSLPDTIRTQLKEIDFRIEKALKSGYKNLDKIIMEKLFLMNVYAFDRREPLFMTLEKIPEDMATIHYSYSDSLLTSCVWFKNETKIHQQKIDKQFFAHIDTVASKTRMFGTSTYESYTRYMSSLNYLHDVFVPNLPKDAKRLLIIPFAKLYQVPFEALTNSKPADEWADFTNIEYLVNRYAISYAPSVGTLQGNESISPGKAIAFLPQFENDSLTLPYSKDEANALKDNFSTDIVEGAEANKDNFFKLLPEYDIISVISHGEDEEIILSNDTIKAEELYQLNLNNSLTVLSTCKSNAGELQSTEGYFGTARKFLESGSGSVAASLWDIPDESTKDIMTDFYKHLSDGDPKDIALQKAKVNYLESNWSVHRSPSFWAGLVLIGNSDEIKQPYRKLYVVALGILFFLALFTLIIKYFRRTV